MCGRQDSGLSAILSATFTPNGRQNGFIFRWFWRTSSPNGVFLLSDFSLGRFLLFGKFAKVDFAGNHIRGFHFAVGIGFAKIAANRRVTGRRPAQLAVLDDADAAEGQQRLRGVPHGLGEQGFDFGCDIMNEAVAHPPKKKDRSKSPKRALQLRSFALS